MLTNHRNRLAKLRYEPGTYKLLSAGDHVLCAVSGAVIPLEMLKYWSADRQEAYASAQLSAHALLGISPAA